MTKSVTLAIIAFIFLSVFSSFVPAPSTTALGSVYFGTPQSFGGACVGRGLCRNTTSATGTGDGVTVSFSLLENNPDVLVMTFSLAQLRDVQPEQVENFVAGNYMFDATYQLSDAPFTSLNLPPNSRITPNSPSQVVINGDVVTDYITYTHD